MTMAIPLYNRPSYVLRLKPKRDSIEGRVHWSVSHGDITGYGRSAADACDDFDHKWSHREYEP